ncbi:hypothetical protein Dvina_51690 [Dactylosporangium vinaceum]|uniref:Uncharacterized protein n=1 Tax=Dactylosporangium vinaceum TaxID=53362 RepID=A0ABV5M2N5_9ACTN|nr:hypothetical protein [Dactylosporangium vinaceum]UAB96309.1 hypothetical protein Dvina_51690 [Dactylosporangium vinaceum]
MTTHPPHHSNHPTNSEPATGPDVERDAAFDGDDDGRPLVDLVAGDPPVPISVWRTARAGGDHGASIPARLARRLVAAYSRTGEAVVDLTDDHALTTACGAGDRRHHRAWFTDVASLIIGPATTGEGAHDGVDDETDTDIKAATGRPLHHGASPGRSVRTGPAGDEPGIDDIGELADVEPVWALADWFGDDLTDPDLPPADGSVAPVAPVPDGVSLSGQTSLVVASWPLDPDPAAGRVRLAWLLTACRELLRPGGCLVLVVAVPAGHPAATTGDAAGRGVTPEDFSPIVDAAARTGLGYLQHIVAVSADIGGEHGDTFVYHVDDEELLALSKARAQSEGQTWAVAHLRVHADLLVFTPSQVPPARTRRRTTRSGGDGSSDGGGKGREGGGRRG